MKVQIPCPSCGCQYCEALTKDGEKVRIDICRCNDGSGEFDITITHDKQSNIYYEKHQCTEDEISGYLSTRFSNDLDSISHQCFN